jgi:hypothetical protein
MRRKTNAYFGKWRIIEMEMWDQDFIDLETEGYFTFDKDQLGSFEFGVVQGHLDYSIEDINGLERLDFSWEGSDENNPVSGRGWVIIEGELLNGKIYFHLGDSSGFKAQKIQ